MFGDDFFVGNPKNSVFYDMLKFATYACISALGVKKQKQRGNNALGGQMICLGLIKTLWRNTLFAKISDWIV